ncbi:fructose-specific PTS transporter subunit EIIC [Streptococcus mutans]|nr:fructose-specific PTS transporter subunit EIIC [Streptococcus mutans]
MKIQDLLNKDVMLLDLQATTKEAAIDEMVSKLVEQGIVTDFDTFKAGIMNREAQTSTGLGDGIAMPHSKNKAVKEATVLFAKSNKGVDYEALDGEPVDLFFMIAAPDGANDTHLAALAELSQYLLKDGFADKLRQVTNPDDVINRFNGKPLISRPVAEGIKKPEELINIILDGKAEAYVADNSDLSSEASSSEKAGLGSAFYKHLMSGVSQMLPFVIGGGIMIALSFLIDQFMGVPKSSLSHLGNYHEIAAIFNQVGNAAFGFMIPVFAAYIAYSIAEKPGLVAGFVAGSMATTGLAFNKVAFFEFGEKASQASLTGIPSGFLGALAGGFLAGGVILVLKKALAFVPRSLEGIKSILLYPLLGVLVTGFLMLFVNIPMAAINTALYNFLGNLSGGSAVLLGLIVGGMMAIDMGGPFNKAAYVFGTSTLTAAALAKGGSVVMASVMAGGMVPPLAVFVATLLFKNKFTQEEHDAGLTNIVMGLSFITEGAIPFGAGDPARAIPSFIVGSAVTGALVGLSGIKLMAPHGGIFVIALTSNPLLYLLYIAVGAVIAGILFGSLRKVR